MKEWICTAVGLVGGAVAMAFGGWSAALTTLIIFMAIDYLTGLLVAGLFHASKKTEHGGLESRAGWKGLVRKGVTLLVVLVACRLDLLLGVNYVRDAAVIGFCANEALSILENTVLMGVKWPAPVKAALELLMQKSEPTENNEPAEKAEISQLGTDYDYRTGFFNLLDEKAVLLKRLEEIELSKEVEHHDGE